MKKTLVIFLTTFQSIPLLAALNLTSLQAEQILNFTAPNGTQEVCLIPNRYPETRYKARDLRKEQELCSQDFHRNVALCPKTNSTNPAVYTHRIDAARGHTSKEQLEAINCEGATREGKYKNSTSCSYAPSIIGYYHFSKILGDIANVPVSVARTLDVYTHQSVAIRGVALTRAPDLINTTWNNLLGLLNQGISFLENRTSVGPRASLVLTTDRKQSFGAYSENPKNEIFYRELFNGGTDRAAGFRDNNRMFRLVRDQRLLSEIVPATWSQESVQKLHAMLDITEFVVLDHLLNQQDRFGNIAAYIRIGYFKKQDDGSYRLTLEKEMKDYDKDLAAGLVDTTKPPLRINSMVLKDNDCGVNKTNVVRTAGLLNLLGHMSPELYRKLRQLKETMPAQKSFFLNTLHFTERDYSSVRANLNEVVEILERNCRAGTLKLDLKINSYLSTGVSEAESCDG
jgi:hypothetical protein